MEHTELSVQGRAGGRRHVKAVRAVQSRIGIEQYSIIHYSTILYTGCGFHAKIRTCGLGGTLQDMRRSRGRLVRRRAA